MQRRAKTCLRGFRIDNTKHMLTPSFVLVLTIFSQQVRVGGRNNNTIHSERFPIELNRVFFDFNS